MENVQGDVSISLVFSCSYEFKGEGDLEEPYIELYRSEFFTDFPTVPELLNPFLTDLFIKMDLYLIFLSLRCLKLFQFF